MRCIYLLSLLILLVNLSWAQRVDPNQYKVTLNEKCITPAANFEEVRTGLKSQHLTHAPLQANHYTRILMAGFLSGNLNITLLITEPIPVVQ